MDRSTNSAPRCPSDDSLEDRADRARPSFAESHHDAGDGERGEELQQSAADAGDETERRLGEVADLRLHALHECGQIVVRLRPECVHLLADQRPLGDACSWRRHLERVVLHVVDEPVHRVAERVHQRRGRHDDHDDAEQHEQRRGQSLTAAELCGHRLMQGIESDGQNQRPGHEAQERGEHLKAEHDQGQDEAGANEDVEKQGGGPAFELGIGIGQCAHRYLQAAPDRQSGSKARAVREAGKCLDSVMTSGPARGWAPESSGMPPGRRSPYASPRRTDAGSTRDARHAGRTARNDGHTHHRRGDNGERVGITRRDADEKSLNEAACDECQAHAAAHTGDRADHADAKDPRGFNGRR